MEGVIDTEELDILAEVKKLVRSIPALVDEAVNRKLTQAPTPEAAPVPLAADATGSLSEFQKGLDMVKSFNDIIDKRVNAKLDMLSEIGEDEGEEEETENPETIEGAVNEIIIDKIKEAREAKAAKDAETKEEKEVAEEPPKPSLSVLQIDEYLKQIPAYLKNQIKSGKITKQECKNYISGKGLTEEQFEYAYKKIREKDETKTQK